MVPVGDGVDEDRSVDIGRGDSPGEVFPSISLMLTRLEITVFSLVFLQRQEFTFTFRLRIIIRKYVKAFDIHFMSIRAALRNTKKN